MYRGPTHTEELVLPWSLQNGMTWVTCFQNMNTIGASSKGHLLSQWGTGMAPQAQLEDPDEYSGGGLWMDRVLNVSPRMLSLLMAMCDLGEGLTALQQANCLDFYKCGPLQLTPNGSGKCGNG